MYKPQNLFPHDSLKAILGAFCYPVATQFDDTGSSTLFVEQKGRVSLGSRPFAEGLPSHESFIGRRLASSEKGQIQAARSFFISER